MEKLTAQQAKMVLEYFAAQAAEDMPDPAALIQTWDKHLWMTQYATSLAVERQIKSDDWDTLIDACMDLQKFDRDPQGWAFDHGIDPGFHIDAHRERVEDQVSFAIDNCWNNSGA